MLSALSNWLYRVASWKTLLLAGALYVPFPAYVLPALEAQLNGLAGYAIGPIDLLFGYDPAKIQRMVADYGPAGRAVYARGELTVDVAYPLVYTFLFCLILSLLFRRQASARGRLINTLPVSTLAFDLLENACIVFLLTTYPAPGGAVAALCALFTNLKWGTSAAVLVAILAGLLGRIRRAQRPSRTG